MLMEQFYRNWKQLGMSPLEALVAAQRWLRVEGTDEPFCWAAFVFHGA
jgi:CHAT domain-containing protein